ncbi:MAG: hypothetical protein IJK14_06915 [Clostridia bacterium]|nr:hypothetical protein [Clostridia bacterium]MBR0445081.1 hypothetical protein [Clostridia bacterium]
MTVGELCKTLDLTPFSVADEDRPISGGYIGDLLSWVMGRAESDQVWITIMSNQNIVAVATLADVAMILLAEGVCPDEGVANIAASRGINLYGSKLPAFELATRIGSLI